MTAPDRDERAAGNVAGDGRTHLVGGDDTVRVLQRGGEVGEGRRIDVEALEGLVEQAFDLGVDGGVLGLDTLFKGSDLYLVDSIDVGDYAYGPETKRTLIKRHLNH